MPSLLVGRCPKCDTAVSYFARRCPRCHSANWPNPVATTAAVLAVGVIGGAIALGALLFARSKTPPAPAPTASEPNAEATDDYGWIVKAMAECDVVAKQSTGAFHFLIVPTTTTGKTVQGWAPTAIGRIGDFIALVSATDALLGLRNGVLTLYSKEVTFAVSDPKTNTVYKWKPAVGVSELSSRETSIEAAKLGFQIAELGEEIAWGPTIKIVAGNCYWTNAVIRQSAHK